MLPTKDQPGHGAQAGWEGSTGPGRGVGLDKGEEGPGGGGRGVVWIQGTATLGNRLEQQERGRGNGDSEVESGIVDGPWS